MFVNHPLSLSLRRVLAAGGEWWIELHFLLLFVVLDRADGATVSPRGTPAAQRRLGMQCSFPGPAAEGFILGLVASSGDRPHDDLEIWPEGVMQRGSHADLVAVLTRLSREPRFGCSHSFLDV